MKHIKPFVGILIMAFALSWFTACSSAKDSVERQNLMMPKKSEMPRNYRYKEIEKRKTYKPKTNKNRR